MEELPSILWTYRTIPRCLTGETPFALAYEMEAVIPLEIGLPTLRTELVKNNNNDDLDLAEEKREQSAV